MITEKGIMNTICEFGEKTTINNKRFKSFINGCLIELRKKGETVCFNDEQLEELKKHNIVYERKEDYYIVRLR